MTLVWEKCQNECLKLYGDYDASPYSSSYSDYDGDGTDNNYTDYNSTVYDYYNLTKCQVACFDDYLIWRCKNLDLPSKNSKYWALRLLDKLSSSLENHSWHGGSSLDKEQIKCHMLTG